MQPAVSSCQNRREPRPASRVVALPVQQGRVDEGAKHAEPADTAARIWCSGSEWEEEQQMRSWSAIQVPAPVSAQTRFSWLKYPQNVPPGGPPPHAGRAASN